MATFWFLAKIAVLVFGAVVFVVLLFAAGFVVLGWLGGPRDE